MTSQRHDTAERAEGRSTAERAEGRSTAERAEGRSTAERAEGRSTAERAEGRSTAERAEARSADAVRAAARLAKVAGSALAEAELTLPQYRVLVFLAPRGRPATHVAALLGVTPSTVTSVVDGLVTRGMVQRSTDESDRRRVVLSLTPVGERTVARGDAVVGAGLDRLLTRLDPHEAEAALVGLELLNRAMEAALDERFGTGRAADADADEQG